MMIVALIAVLGIMRYLDGSARPGIPKPPSLSTTIELCPTRVTRLHAGKLTIFEEGMQWFRQNEGSTRERLDPVAVEKWFSRHCSMEATKVSASADVHEALKVFFVTGEPQVLLESASGEFEWMHQPFKATQMATALKELLELPIGY